MWPSGPWPWPMWTMTRWRTSPFQWCALLLTSLFQRGTAPLCECAHLSGTPGMSCQTPEEQQFMICQFRGCCTLYLLWKIRTVTSCQTYWASLGLKTLQASPSKTSPSKRSCIFPALRLLAEDRLLKILSEIWFMFQYFKENVLISFHMKSRYLLLSFAALRTF